MRTTPVPLAGPTAWSEAGRTAAGRAAGSRAEWTATGFNQPDDAGVFRHAGRWGNTNPPSSIPFHKVPTYDLDPLQCIFLHRGAILRQDRKPYALSRGFGFGSSSPQLSNGNWLINCRACASSDMSRVPDDLLPKVAIVGRPNVGKSALFNRLAGGSYAIVNDEPGVTRDRLYGRGYWGQQEFMLIDTGGVLSIPKSGSLGTDGIAVTSGGGQLAIKKAVQEASLAGLPSMIEKQAAIAVEDASIIIFVADGQAGMTSVDMDISEWLRRRHSDKKIVLAVNKCESPTKGLMQATEFWSLGFEVIAVSAISATGTGDLLDLISSWLAPFKVEQNKQEDEDRIPAFAIIGKPNVGKSSILNSLVGKERAIVSPVSGTTRDAIDTDITGPDGKVYRLIDTAGIRRRAAVASAGSKTEGLSVNRALRAIRRSDVVALVIDAMTCATEQDYKLGEIIQKEGKGCVIVINKWDTVPNKDNKSTLYYEQDVREKLRVLDWAPIVYTSITARQRVGKILEAAIEVEKERSRRLSTGILNQVVQEALALNPPPKTRGGKKGRVFYCTQAAVRPPTFVFFVNESKYFTEVYRRYMEKQLRSNVGYKGTPIRLLWRSKQKGDHDKASKSESTIAAASELTQSDGEEDTEDIEEEDW